jgi:hypothetical protein
VPPLGDPVEFDHHAVEFQHLFRDGVSHSRRVALLWLGITMCGAMHHK